MRANFQPLVTLPGEEEIGTLHIGGGDVGRAAKRRELADRRRSQPLILFDAIADCSLWSTCSIARARS